MMFKFRSFSSLLLLVSVVQSYNSSSRKSEATISKAKSSFQFFELFKLKNQSSAKLLIFTLVNYMISFSEYVFFC